MDQECRGMTGGTCLCGEPPCADALGHDYPPVGEGDDCSRCDGKGNARVDHLQEILPAAAGGQGQPWTAERQRDAGPALAAADVLDQWAGHYLG